MLCTVHQNSAKSSTRRLQYNMFQYKILLAFSLSHSDAQLLEILEKNLDEVKTAAFLVATLLLGRFAMRVVPLPLVVLVPVSSVTFVALVRRFAG